MAQAAPASLRVAPAIFSPEWIATWRQALQEGHPWAQLVISNAQKSGTPDQRYGDEGDWGTFAYLITGDVTYADKAWSVIASRGLGVPDANGLREDLTARALLYYGLKQGGYWQLHPDHQQAMIDSLNNWSDAVFTSTGVAYRMSDSDQTVGALGVMLWGLVSRGDNPRAAEYLGHPKLGGLTPTAEDQSTVRNAVAEFCRSAAGGEWIEASDYNLGTVRLLLMATEGVRALTGRDYFPEAKALYKQMALSQMSALTPDLAQSYQWGDEEWPRSLKLFYRESLLGMLAGVTQDDPSVGPYVQQFVTDLANKYGWTGGLSTAEPFGRTFYLFDPHAPSADWRTLPEFTAPAGGLTGWDSPGLGFSFLRDGTGASDTFAGLMSYNSPGVDHSLRYMSDFQLYRKGEWVVTHPLMYDPGPQVANTLLVAGLGKMSEASGRIGYELPSDGTYAYSAATTGGNFGWAGYWAPPATFLHEATRSLFYLPGGGADGVPTLVVFDRVNADPPTRDGFHYDSDWATISGSPLKQIVFHTPVAPTITSLGSGQVLSWPTTGGQQVQVDLLTGGLQTSVVQETTGVLGGYAHPQELHYLAQVLPDTYRKFDTFVSVVQASDPGSDLSNTRVTSDGGEAEGVLVHRAGEDDALVLFNAGQAPDLQPRQTDSSDRLIYNPDLLNQISQGRFHKSGFTVSAVTATASADVYLADLDPAIRWTAVVDGQPASLSVSGAGIGRLTLSGIGSHTVTVSPAADPATAAGSRPVVVSQTPLAYSGVSDASTVSITARFNEAIDPASVQFVLQDASGQAITGQLGYDPATFTVRFTPAAGLAPATTYTATLVTASNLAGNSIAQPYSWNFTTRQVPYELAGAYAATVKVVYDSSGSLHMAWFDANSKTLKYSRRTSGGMWLSVETVDASWYAGQELSIAIDRNGNPGIAYYDGFNADLKYAHSDGGMWSIAPVDTKGRVGRYPSLVFSSKGIATVAYYAATSGDLRLAIRSATGTWAKTVLDSVGDVGRSASIALDSATGQYFVGYEDTSAGTFKYALSGRRGVWSVGIVDESTHEAGGGIGAISAAFSNDHVPAMTYYDCYQADLKFAMMSRGRWLVRTVATRRSQGQYSWLGFDPATGAAGILYWNKSGSSILSASMRKTGWNFALVASLAGEGLNVARGTGNHRSLAWLTRTGTGELDIAV